ncbi:universal stress protein [Streptomyces thermoviolaceus]|uniref:universal stress protein n=1 Tax=Streptomyces thermoviolaceus TaxID=1952 RepID=UPI0020416664|nr:universal stress protein [Streptomyces thermoviolaceus]MCM3263850.1 universal stress protein [Streptomyces thermoviolaceus]
MDQPLVVGVDGSGSALRAVDWAADEAALRRLPLRLVYAPLWVRYESAEFAGGSSSPDTGKLVELIVRGAARRARRRQPDLPISTAVLSGSPEDALVRESEHAWALAVGSRGRGGVPSLLLGSVSLFVAAHAACPVIVVRGDQDPPARLSAQGRIVVGAGDTSGAAVRFAAEEADRRGSVLEVVMARRRPAAHEPVGRRGTAAAPDHAPGRRAAEALEAALRDIPEGVTIQQRLVDGPARHVLLDLASTADLLVIGAGRRAGHAGLPLGRVAHTVLHHSPCPVAVVPEPPVRARG